MSTSTNLGKLLSFVNNKISQNTQFAIPLVKMNELLQDLLHLDINKSTGTDNIGPMILKVSATFIVSPLTYIFNRIIDSSIYPNILKNAKVLLTKLSSLPRLVEVDIFSLLRFSTQEVKNLLKVFAISIELSTFRSFSVTSLWGLKWFDGFRLCIHLMSFPY
jgi:hypothetical protein